MALPGAREPLLSRVFKVLAFAYAPVLIVGMPFWVSEELSDVADARRRTSDLADDAIAAPKDDHIVSLSTTGPQSLGRERDPLLGLRDEVGHGLVEDVLLVGR